MRHIAVKKDGHLSDTSLIISNVRQEHIKTERDVFKALDIKYYEPHERNGWMKEQHMPWGKHKTLAIESDSENDINSDSER